MLRRLFRTASHSSRKDSFISLKNKGQYDPKICPLHRKHFIMLFFFWVKYGSAKIVLINHNFVIVRAKKENPFLKFLFFSKLCQIIYGYFYLKKNHKKNTQKNPCHRKTIFTKMMKTSILKQNFMFYMKIKDFKKMLYTVTLIIVYLLYVYVCVFF